MYEPRSKWRDRRNAANLSLRRLAILSGINRGTISRIERGWPASPEQAAALVAALDLVEKGA
jgi:transcriptional regulator with XRE-family HTH domain